MFSGLPKHCCARCATPHGVVGAAASPTATDREPLTGFGARSGTSSCYRDGSPDGLGKDAGTNQSPPPCFKFLSMYCQIQIKESLWIRLL